MSIFGIVGFGIQEGKQNDLDKRLERSGAALERWLDEEDYASYDEY